MEEAYLIARAQHEVAVPDGDLAADEDRDCRVAVGRVGVRVAHDDAAEVQLARPVELPLDAARPLDVGRALLHPWSHLSGPQQPGLQSRSFWMRYLDCAAVVEPDVPARQVRPLLLRIRAARGLHHGRVREDGREALVVRDGVSHGIERAPDPERDLEAAGAEVLFTGQTHL